MGTSLTDSESIRRDHADALPACIYSASPALRMEFANSRAMDFFGIALDDIEGHRWLELVHPDDKDSVLETWQVAVDTASRYVHEHRLRVRGGAYRSFRAEALPLKDTSGAVLRWYGVLTPTEPSVIVTGDLRPRVRPPKLDYYPSRDENGYLKLLEIRS